MVRFRIRNLPGTDKAKLRQIAAPYIHSPHKNQIETTAGKRATTQERANKEQAKTEQ